METQLPNGRMPKPEMRSVAVSGMVMTFQPSSCLNSLRMRLMSVVFPAAGPPVSTILVIRFATRITPSMNVLLLYQFLPRKARSASLCRANGSVGLQYISIFMGKAAFLATAFSVCCRT